MINTFIKILRGTWLPDGVVQRPSPEQRLADRRTITQKLTSKVDVVFKPTLYLKVYARQFTDEFGKVYPTEYCLYVFGMVLMIRLRSKAIK